MTGTETELKSGLSRAYLARLEAQLAARTPAPAGPVLLVTRYFDSTDGRLAAAGIALRLREEGGRRRLSVKSGRAAVGGFQHAGEFEIAQRGRLPDLARLPAQVRASIARHLGDAPIVVRFVTRIRRRTFLLEAPDGLVEVAIDRGTIRAGRRSEPVSEIEFELKGGSPQALFRLAGALLARSPARLDLPNKAARGEALARGAPLPPCAVVASKPPAGVAAEAILERQLLRLAGAIAANLHATLASADPEGPHQLRVALRRLRVLLSLHRPFLDHGLARRLGRTARDLGRILAHLRDADVLVAGPLAAGAGPALRDALLRWHAATRRTVRRRLLEAGATGFALALIELAALGGARRADPRDPAAHRARRLARLWKAIVGEGNRLATLDPPSRHELRKALKKLRYGLELVATGRTAFGEALKRLQQDLGELNDLAVLEAFAPPLGAAALEAEFRALAASRLAAAKPRADLLMGRACRHWQALLATAPPWEAPPAPPQPNR